jgi:cell wall-associated NlpC family hydrolase
MTAQSQRIALGRSFASPASARDDTLLALRRADLAGGARAPAPWCFRYTGIPFAKKGYDRAGVNCWGLVCFVFLGELGTALPRHEEAYEERHLARDAGARELAELTAIFRRHVAPDWRPIAPDALRPFDVVHIPIAGEPAHVGLYAGGCHLLHVEDAERSGRKGLSHVEDLRIGRLKARLVRAEFYRHRSREAA